MLNRHETVQRVSAAPVSAWAGIAELRGARDLFVLLLRRELQVRYKQTALGLIWVVLQPLVPAVILSIVFGTFARLPSAGLPYILFALSGLILYGLFAGIVSRAGGSLLRDSHLITRVYFPRVVLPLAAGSAALVDFMIGFALLGVLILALGQPLAVSIVVAPVLVVLTCGVAFGVGVGLAALTAYFRDFHHAIPFLLQLLLYASPVLYSLEILPPSVRSILALNPLVSLIEGFRWALFGTAQPDFSIVLPGLLAGLALIIVGLSVFWRAQRDMADVI
jgi:lipopolysaccharide transport system permease protein